ncbi:MAG: sel1 repeat family protein [Sphingomonadales bacterium]|nr:sel1 repeat family protein [Sphingomonadales bacterium]MBD3774420.1 sel1 repeat family protein [Paracoccaceae bacterium]
MSALLSSLLLMASSPAASFPEEAYEVVVSDEVRAVLAARDGLQGAEIAAQLDDLFERGDDSAGELLGEAYNFGVLGLTADDTRACDYFEKLADKRPDAAHNFATCYYNGRGRERDFAKARVLYRQAGEGGWLMGQCAYGNMLVRGQGGPSDVAQGLAICRHAAELGDANAQADVGTYYLTGEFVTRDPVEARKWLAMAGDQGQMNAAFLLAQIYQRGDGVDKDLAAARSWFIRAHEAGRNDAAYWVLALTVTGAMRDEGGNSTLDPAAFPEIRHWAALTIEHDPAPARRQMATDMLNSLDGK